MRRGAEVAAELLKGLDGDPASFGRALGMSVGDALEVAKSSMTGYTQVALGELGKLRRVVDLAKRGVPTEPSAFAALAVEILLPFPQAGLNELRRGLTQIFEAAAQVRLPLERTSGLVIALDGVAAAAHAGNAAALAAAIANLERVRASVTAAIQNELVAVHEKVGRLQLETTLRPMISAADIFQIADEGILDFLQRFRAIMADARQLIDPADLAEGMTVLPKMLDFLEESLRTEFVERVDAQVEALKQWLRDLFAELPLRALREKLRQQFHAAARAIEDADLDRFARPVREKLAAVRAAIDSADLGEGMRSSLQAAAQKIEQALDGILGAMDVIKTQIEAVAGQAEGIPEAYDSLVGVIALPGTGTALRRSTEALDPASRGRSKAVMEPVKQLAPTGTVGSNEGQAAKPPSIEGVRPGDVIRMFAYLPNKLREALAKVGAGPAGAALAALHGLSAGLAADLRNLVPILCGM